MLTIQKNGRTDTIPLSQVRHLLVMGGHTLHTSVITQLLAAGSSISFFHADGEPVGFLRPYGDRFDEIVREAQRGAFAHSYALAIAKGATHARILEVGTLQEEYEEKILYEGELEILGKSRHELEFLIRMEEIRRIHRLVVDMYYEILSRTLPSGLGFRRRLQRPYVDVVNAMLSCGYAMLYGNMCVAVIGADLDPDLGLLHKGRGGLVYDLIDSLKPVMVDRAVFAIAREGIFPEEYECSGSRCVLSDELVQRLASRIRETIDQELIDTQVTVFRDAILKKTEFVVCRPEHR